LHNEQRPDYTLARRNRGPDLGHSRFRLDDPSAGLRVYFVNLAPGERKTPPVTHKGTELVLVARGLVLVDLGSASPRVRARDAILVTRAPIISWHNLSPGPSILFWISATEAKHANRSKFPRPFNPRPLPPSSSSRRQSRR
jgi:hypothetical protein